MSPSRLVLACALVVAAPAAATAEPLGASPEQYIITSDARFDYQRTSTSLADEDAGVRTDYAMRLAADYTVAARVSFGGLIGFEGTSSDDDDSLKSFLFGGRAGYLVPLGGATTWWPRVGLSYRNTSGLDALGRSITIGAFRLNASAPFVFQPYPQVLVGIGPTYDRDLTAKSGQDTEAAKTSAIGVHLLFGLWFY